MYVGGHVSKPAYLDSELPKTRCEQSLRDAVEELAKRSERDVAFVIRRAVRELIEREKAAARKTGKAA